MTQTITYDAWGVPSYSGYLDSRLMWKGLLWEGDAAGLYYMRGRWYDPELGRFIQEDPIHSGVNDYAFAGDDPINGSDPSGLDDECHVSEETSCALPPIVTIAAGPGEANNSGYESYVSGRGGSGFGSFGGEGGGGSGASGTPPQPKPKPKKCSNGIGSGGIGVGIGGNVDAGVGFAAASATAGAGGGLFHNGAGGITSGWSGGTFGSAGGAYYAGAQMYGAPTQTSSTFSLGAYAGAGANFYFTNAASVQQLDGPFTTLSLNVGVGIANLGFQGSFGGGIWQVTITPPLASVGLGLAGSIVTTNTATSHTGCR